MKLECPRDIEAKMDITLTDLPGGLGDKTSFKSRPGIGQV